MFLQNNNTEHDAFINIVQMKQASKQTSTRDRFIFKIIRFRFFSLFLSLVLFCLRIWSAHNFSLLCIKRCECECECVSIRKTKNRQKEFQCVMKQHSLTHTQGVIRMREKWSVHQAATQNLLFLPFSRAGTETHLLNWAFSHLSCSLCEFNSIRCTLCICICVCVPGGDGDCLSISFCHHFLTSACYCSDTKNTARNENKLPKQATNHHHCRF